MRSILRKVVLAGLLATGAGTAHATVVTNTADSGPGSLRQAILDTENGGTITFSITGTINLTSGPLGLDNGVIIDGPGAGLLTVQRSAAAGTANFGVFENYFDSEATIKDLTIRNGSAEYGGGIDNAGVLVLERVVISGNRATVDGGGIYNDNDIVVRNCTISGNSAKGGAGLAHDAFDDALPALIENSTFSGNVASGQGGGLYVLNNEVQLRSCTVTANSAPSGEGSGIASYGDEFTTAVLSNSIVADNSTTDVDYVEEGINSFVSAGYNLVGDGNGAVSFGLSGDRKQAAAKLGALASNGGQTPTHLPLTGSLAIDAGKTTLTEDQRGLKRPVDQPAIANAAGGNASDIGAVEVAAATAADTVAPTIAVTAPARGASIFTLPAISGTATDNVGVTRVVFYLKRNADSKYWNGTAWGTTTALTTTLGGTATNRTWTRSSALPAGANLPYGSYTVTAYAFDAANNRTSVVSGFLRHETEPPTITIASPAHKAVLKNGLTAISGTTADTGGSNVKRVVVYLRRYSDSKHWNGTSWGGAFALPATLSGGQWSLTEGLPQGTNLQLGAYVLTAYAIDFANNRQSVVHTFTISEGVKPVVRVTSPANASTVSTLTQVAGTASDSGGSGLKRVAFYLRRMNDGKYWSGSAWVTNVVELPTTISGGSWTSPAVPTGANLVDGVYQARAIAVDGSFNTSTTAISQFTLKRPGLEEVSRVVLSAARAAGSIVTLTFTGPVAAGGSYSLSHDGVELEISSVQHAAPDTVLLSAEGLTVGAPVTVSYATRDTTGKLVSGTATVTVR